MPESTPIPWFTPQKRGELLLKELNIFPEDEVGAGDDAMNGCVHHPARWRGTALSNRQNQFPWNLTDRSASVLAVAGVS